MEPPEFISPQYHTWFPGTESLVMFPSTSAQHRLNYGGGRGTRAWIHNAFVNTLSKYTPPPHTIQSSHTLYKAPTNYTKPPHIIQSSHTLYNATTHYTKPSRSIQSPHTVCWARTQYTHYTKFTTIHVKNKWMFSHVPYQFTWPFF